MNKCRMCGCTEDDCSNCIEQTGEPCSWVEPDLCSACATEISDDPFADNAPRRVTVEGTTKKRKKATSGKVAEGHADALIALMWPGSPVAKAGRKVSYIWRLRRGQAPRPCYACGLMPRVPRTQSEDICGVFDRVVFGPSSVIAIQATVKDAVSARRRKIESEYLEKLPDGGAPTYMRIEVWGWELRKMMHVWAWSWAEQKWFRETGWRIKGGALVAEART